MKAIQYIWLMCLPVLLVLIVTPVNASGISETITAEQYKARDGKKADKLLTIRKRQDQLIWGGEVAAQQYEARFTQLWNNLLTVEDKYSVLAKFPFTQLFIGEPAKVDKLDLQILRTTYTSGSNALTPEKWQKLLADFKVKGYEIVQTEWHHSGFVPPDKDKAAHSDVSFEIHAARKKPTHRVIIKGVLGVDWSKQPDSEGLPVPREIRVTSQQIFERHAPAAFSEVFTVNGTKENPLILPLHVYDLDKDGLSEIIVAGQNLLLQNKGAGKFEAGTFLEKGVPIYDTGVLADFTGDSNIDFVTVNNLGYPLIFKGDPQGRFNSEGKRIADIKFRQPKTITTGDIDADGDLDLYIANYKFPYREGQMPTPYYDANDGFPAYLLRNDSNDKFTDITKSSGLAPKRNRRVFSSSFIDLDDDNDQDLVVVSDYAGLDMYMNDGQGKFTDVTDSLGLDRHFFGMGHTFADYDLDGKQDMYVIGMSSTTARRLEGMKLGRSDKPKHNEMRKVMGYGNRIFLGKENKFIKAPFNDQVARTGWSWGASSFDFDNDGDKDIFVTNGHYSGKSTQDYCSTFWRHDIYEGSRENTALDTLFQSVTKDLRNADISWNGYEHKVLLMNEKGKGFVNIAFLMGVAFEYDARSVIADDLDGDGRVDLLVVEFKTAGRDKNIYRLHVYKNTLDQAGHWVGIRLQDYGSGLSPIGAMVSVKTSGGEQKTRLVTGDSFSAQHSSTIHFGLGAATSVESIEVSWPNGKKVQLKQPVIDQYHNIKPAMLKSLVSH